MKPKVDNAHYGRAKGLQLHEQLHTEPTHPAAAVSSSPFMASRAGPGVAVGARAVSTRGSLRMGSGGVGWPILRSTPDERHVVLRVGLGKTVVAEVYLMARRHQGGAVVSLTLMAG